jgi:nucleoside-diphosphate-sugar epimerase
MKKALVFGAGGFIGSHTVNMLKKEGYFVRGVDLKYPEFSKTAADEFLILDLRVENNVSIASSLVNGEIFDELYQYAFSMGGAGYIFTGENDIDVMSSNLINHNVILHHKKYKKIFYASSACIYPQYNQMDPNNPKCSEDSWIPSAPDSEYGWTKLFDERLYLTLARLTDTQVRIARFHNIFGPEGTWAGGKEKAPAAMCRKIAMLPQEGGEIEIWGDGEQTRSFLYIDDCIEGILRLMSSDFIGPVNIGSEEMVTINKMVELVAQIAEKNVTIKHIDGPLGVRGRNSDNKLIKEKLNWEPKYSLYEGLVKTYNWITSQIQSK